MDNKKMITTLWVLPHIIVFINRNNNTIINLCCFLMLLIILFIKPVTYDLPWYFAYYEIVHKNLHEYGFEVIITILNFIFRDGKLVHYGLTILSLVFISLSVRNHLNISGQKKLLLIGIITLGSIFFMVGTQNNVRQFVAISVLLISLLNLNSTNLNKLSKLGYFALIIFSIFIHWSNIFVVLLFFLSYLIKNIKDNTIEVNHLLLNSFSKVIFFILGIVLLFVLSSLYQGSDYVYTSERLDLDFIFSGRSSNIIKVLFISIIFFITSILTYQKKINNYFVNLRGDIFFFILPLSIMPIEGFARFLFIYFSAELIACCVYIHSRVRNERFSGLIIFLFYAVANNVINIITGQNYL